MCPDGTIPYVGMDFVPDVTYFLWALCPGGTIPYVGIVFRGDHALCWILFLM